MMKTYSGDFDRNLADGRPRDSDEDGDREGIPELLSLDGVAALSSERAIGAQTIGQANEDPDEDDRKPSGETMVALEEAIRCHCYQACSSWSII